MNTKRMLVIRDANVQNGPGLKGSGVHFIYAVGHVEVDIADPASLVPGSSEEADYYRQDVTGMWVRLIKVYGVSWTESNLWVKLNRLADLNVVQPVRDRMFTIVIPAVGVPTIKEV